MCKYVSILLLWYEKFYESFKNFLLGLKILIADDDIDQAFQDYKGSLTPQLNLFYCSLSVVLAVLTAVFAFITHYKECFSLPLTTLLQIIVITIVISIAALTLYSGVKLKKYQILIEVLLTYFMFFEFFNVAFSHFWLFWCLMFWTFLGVINWCVMSTLDVPLTPTLQISTISQ